MPTQTDYTPDNEGSRGGIGTYSGVGEEKEKRKIQKRRKGTVTDLYAHIFRITWAGAQWKECFAYSMLQRREGSWIEVKGVR